MGKIILAVSHFSSVTGEAGHLFLFFYVFGKCLFIACLLFTIEHLSFIKLLNCKSALNITLTLNNTRTCCKSSHSPPVPRSPTSPCGGVSSFSRAPPTSAVTQGQASLVSLTLSWHGVYQPLNLPTISPTLVPGVRPGSAKHTPWPEGCPNPTLLFRKQ